MANSLKNLMQTKSFQKISINDICSGCNMNRKSFYYHFQDKYDLLNWIFDTEFREFQSTDIKILLPQLCHFFYNNHNFYRKALLVDGQNSFRSHLYDILYRATSKMLENIAEDEDFEELQIQFITDGIMCALIRWIVNPACINADEFMSKISSLIAHLIKVITAKYSNN